MELRGRHLIGIWLAFFLLILAWVAARQTSAVVAAAKLGELRSNRAALEARKAELMGELRTARSRAVLLPRAESLGLRLPAADSELVILKLPGKEPF